MHTFCTLTHTNTVNMKINNLRSKYLVPAVQDQVLHTALASISLQVQKINVINLESTSNQTKF